METTTIATIGLTGYLLGSIPTGYLVGRAKGIDIRQHGSKNIGATNISRTLGKNYGLFVFACDALKGILAVVLGYAMWAYMGKADYHSAPALAGIIGALAAILGHNFPVWLKFKGGKGVATSLGVVFGLVPVAASVAAATWLLVFFATRYVSLASLVATLAVPVTVALTAHGNDRMALLAFTSFAALLIVLRHKENIKRLLNGTENRFSKSKQPQP